MTVIPPLARGLRWGPLLGAAATSVVVLAIAVRADGPAVTLAGLRIAALLLGAGAGIALDDPAAPTLAATPIGPPRRRSLHLLLIGGVAIAVWLTLLTVALHVASRGVPGDVSVRVSLEAAAILVSGLAVAAVAIRSNRTGMGGSIAGPVLFVGMLGAVSLQHRWAALTLFPSGPADPRWPAAGTAMTVTLAVTTVLLVWASLDAGRYR